MGHLRRNELVVAYNRIKRDAVGRTCSILILVTPTVDGLCALKILTVQTLRISPLNFSLGAT